MALPIRNAKTTEIAGLDTFYNGGKGSGNFGHSGRPGEVGGSGKGGKSVLSVEERRKDLWDKAYSDKISPLKLERGLKELEEEEKKRELYDKAYRDEISPSELKQGLDAIDSDRYSIKSQKTLEEASEKMKESQEFEDLATDYISEREQVGEQHKKYLKAKPQDRAEERRRRGVLEGEAKKTATKIEKLLKKQIKDAGLNPKDYSYLIWTQEVSGQKRTWISIGEKDRPGVTLYSDLVIRKRK